MTDDELKASLAESIRYIRAYGEERLRGAEDLWNSPDEEEELGLQETAPPIPPEISDASDCQHIKSENSKLSGHGTHQPPSSSLLQRLLGW